MVDAPSRAEVRQAPLTPGERLVDVPLINTKNVAMSLYHPRIYGWRKAMFVTRDPAETQAELERFTELAGDFAELDVHVVAVTCATAEENAGWVERLKIPYPVLSDPNGVILRASSVDTNCSSCTLLFDPVLRLEARIAPDHGAEQADMALAGSRAAVEARKPIEITEQSPALVLPNLLDPEHCKALMDYWERGEKLDNVVASRTARQNQANTQSKIRADVILEEGSPDFNKLVGALQRRLFPQIEKAFNFKVTRTERFRIGCYDAQSRGYFAPHRDNTNLLTAHRRYAITINLNTGDYEGGQLKLPEYSAHLYAPAAGGAIVFSCSLLHTALPVTKGRRFVVVGFFWGEAEEQIMQRNYAKLQRESKPAP